MNIFTVQDGNGKIVAIFSKQRWALQYAVIKFKDTTQCKSYEVDTSNDLSLLLENLEHAELLLQDPYDDC